MPQSPRLSLIVAVAENGVIGRDGDLPWRLSADLQRFKQLTTGHPIVMGRKTWDSLPPRFRPLPGRTNIVVTRQPDWKENGVQRSSSLREALQIAEQPNPATVWVIGGAQIYAQALPLAQRVEVTEIAQDFDGDAFAPELGPEWVETTREAHTSTGGMAFAFVRYQRR